LYKCLSSGGESYAYSRRAGCGGKKFSAAKPAARTLKQMTPDDAVQSCYIAM
jgi:hypothetical protein